MDNVRRRGGELSRVDLYCLGPPCQSWSTCGRKAGASDPRGKLLFNFRRYVSKKQPKTIILENVPGLLHFPKHFDKLINQFKKAGYTVYWKILNALDNNVPQNRSRLYLVAFSAEVKHFLKQRTFEFPKALEHRMPLSSILEPKDAQTDGQPESAFSQKQRARLKRNMRKLIGQGVNPDREIVVSDVDSSDSFATFHVGRLPCITASRAKMGGFHLSSHQRRTCTQELMRGQGMSPRRLADWSMFMSASQLREAVGNAMAVPVLERLIARVLYSAGLVDLPMEDKHEDPNFKPAFIE